MGKRGPKPTPTSVLELSGSWRAKKRKADGEPRPEPTLCVCPDWVTGAARAYWPEIAPMLSDAGITTACDSVALGLLVDSLAEYVAAKAEVDQVGLVTVTEKGNVVQHPVVGVMHNSRDAVLRLLREFGMTPSSRTGIQVAGKDGEVIDAAELFFQGKGKAKSK